jgi:hypothetical protein
MVSTSSLPFSVRTDFFQRPRLLFIRSDIITAFRWETRQLFGKKFFPFPNFVLNQQKQAQKTVLFSCVLRPLPIMQTI